jgi:hypothetical protein
MRKAALGRAVAAKTVKIEWVTVKETRRGGVGKETSGKA